MKERMTERERTYRKIVRELMRNPKCEECGKDVMFDDYEYIKTCSRTAVFHRACILRRIGK